jgi:hypothetical protein
LWYHRLLALSTIPGNEKPPSQSRKVSSLPHRTSLHSHYHIQSVSSTTTWNSCRIRVGQLCVFSHLLFLISSSKNRIETCRSIFVSAVKFRWFIMRPWEGLKYPDRCPDKIRLFFPSILCPGLSLLYDSGARTVQAVTCAMCLSHFALSLAGLTAFLRPREVEDGNEEERVAIVILLAGTARDA